MEPNKPNAEPHSFMVIAATPEETAERAMRLSMAGTSNFAMRDVATDFIRLPATAQGLIAGCMSVYRNLPQREYEALVALNVLQKGRVKLKLMDVVAVCRGRGEDGVDEGHKLLFSIFDDLRSHAPLRCIPWEEVEPLS